MNNIAAGIVFLAPSGKVLLLKRAACEQNYGGHWGLPGGKAEEGESPVDAAMREAREETGYGGDFDVMKELSKVTTPTGMEFTTFLVKEKDEFTPVLGDGEHDEWTWLDPTELTDDLKVHPGVRKTLEKIMMGANEQAKDAIALDKDSVRTFDDAGRLHVASAHISKAAINPYRGAEIPGWQSLGLDPEKVYQLFRDPKELALAAKTFENIQILYQHIPVSADDPQLTEVVGTTGTNAEFNDPYLDNELTIWTQRGIDAIESGAQRELSCGYAYDPVMTPGIFNGESYDGRMTNIKGNHVALVSKGRAGPDVVVGDSAIELTQHKETEMTKPLSKTAARVQAALSAFFMPQIALDSQLKFSTALGTSLQHLTRKNLKSERVKIVKLAKDAAEPMMTPEAKKAGASPDDVIMRVLDMVEGQVSSEATPDPEEEDGEPEKKPTDEWRKPIMDALVKSGMDEKGAGAICDMFPGNVEKAKEKVEGEDDMEEGEDEKTPAEKEQMEKDEKAKAEKAMDAKLDAVRDGAVAAMKKNLKDIRAAERAVHPLIGEISVAMDSAEDIYRAALKAHEVNLEGVDASAFPAMVDMLAKQKGEAGRTSVRIAEDAAGAFDARAEFDKANGIQTRRIKNLGA